jgi:hypothetical protein
MDDVAIFVSRIVGCAALLKVWFFSSHGVVAEEAGHVSSRIGLSGGERINSVYKMQQCGDSGRRRRLLLL